MSSARRSRATSTRASRWRHALPGWSLIALWLVAAQGARAQSAGASATEPAPLVRAHPTAEARRQFMIGERLFRAGRYRDAARAYQRGYRLSRRPGFLINIAHCQVRLGRPELAREQYRRFLAEAPDAPHAAQVARALAEIDARLAPHSPTLATAGPQPAEATVSPSTATGAALVEVVEPPPLPLTARDRLHQPSAAEQALRLQAPPPAPRSNRPRWLWPVVGVAAAALVTGTVAVLARRDQRGGTLARGSIGTIRQ
jgi:tetratricopeptide (TPR) repeat protein